MICSSSGGPNFKDVAKAHVASILDGLAQTTVSLGRIYVASYWPPCLQIYRLEKGEEICGDNESDQRQRTALRQCMGRLGLFILEEKLHSGRDWIGFLYVPIQKLGPSNEAESQTESKQK